MEHARNVGNIISWRLKDMQEENALEVDAKGLGAIASIELVKDKFTKDPAKEETAEILKPCHKNGLGTMKGGSYHDVIKLIVLLK